MNSKLFLVYLSAVVILSSCLSRKELVHFDSIKLTDLTEEQMKVHAEYAARTKPWKKQFQYDPDFVEGLRVPEDSVTFIFDHIKKQLTDRIDNAIHSERGIVMGRKLILENELLTSLSYLAQQGNEEIENALLSNFEYAFVQYFTRYNRGKLKNPIYRMYDIYYFQAFNRIPPSERKIKLLLALQGYGGNSSGGEHRYTNANYYVFNFLLLNFEDTGVEDLYLETGTNFLMALNRNKYYDDHSKANEGEYEDLRFDTMYPEFLKRFTNGDLKLKSRISWKNLEIPHF